MIKEIPQIAEKIIQGKAIAFIGAGASFDAKDPYSNRLHYGLPGAYALVEELKKSKSYITSDLNFSQACFLLKKRESKQSLIDFLNRNLNKDINPLPTHKLLASLPFEAYISMNFDRLLEKALTEERKRHYTILKDVDVSMLPNDHIPIIKPHGCFSDPSEIVAAADDETPFLQKFALVDCYLKAKLANKTVVFIGFSLRDKDFEQLHQQIQTSLGPLAPKSYAVFLNPNDYEIEYWQNKNVTVLNCDAGQFLKDLKNFISRQKATDLLDSEKDEWFNHPFFASLNHIKNLPTETQLIDAFLERLIEEVEGGNVQLAEIITNGEEGREKVYTKKANFEAFNKIALEILDGLRLSKKTSDAEYFLLEYRNKRNEIIKNIAKKWNLIINPNDKILLFSQSKRVCQILEAVPKSVKKTCELFIAECRPKCSGHSFFQDSFQTVEDLRSKEYKFTFFPDIVISHLFEQALITKVILGAHTIFVDDKREFKSFVNTSGSLIISQLCEKYNIPLFVIAEDDKERNVSFLDKSKISTSQEVELVDEQSNYLLGDLKHRGVNINILNVGYDLVPTNTQTFYINQSTI